MNTFSKPIDAFISIFNSLLNEQGVDLPKDASPKVRGLLMDLIGDVQNPGGLTPNQVRVYVDALGRLVNAPTKRHITVPQLIQGQPRVLLEKLTLNMTIETPPKATLAPSLVDAFIHLVLANIH